MQNLKKFSHSRLTIHGSHCHFVMLSIKLRGAQVNYWRAGKSMSHSRRSAWAHSSNNLHTHKYLNFV